MRMSHENNAEHVEPSPIIDKENPLESMMKRFDAVYGTAQKHNVTMRIGTYVLAIDKVANTLKVRGIYA